MNTNKEILRLPSTAEVLKKEVHSPFDYNIWTEAFNYLQIKPGDQIKVSETNTGEERQYTLTLPENPTLADILQGTKEFIKEVGIEVNNPKLLILARDLRNTARLIRELSEGMSEDEKKQLESLIVSTYQLGEELERVLNDQPYDNLTEVSFETLTNSPLSDYELPPETNIDDYKDELFLRLLGKLHISFDEKSQKDKKLSLVPEHSAYYYLLEKFIETRKNNLPQDYKGRMKMFDQWLLTRKKLLARFLLPYLSESLKENGRTHTALWETTTHSFFSYLDEAVEEEGGKRAKESLTSPPLFIDLGEDLQKLLKEIFPQDEEALSFDVSRFKNKDTATLIDEIKSQVDTTEYGKMSLFNLAEKVLEKAQEERTLTTLDKITLLWDLVQAYEYEKTYKLTLAVKNKAFECNLRSYILGRLYQQFLKDEVDVYTVIPPNHTRLLVVDRSGPQKKQAYWVDPTGLRFYYSKDEITEKLLQRVENFGEKVAIWKVADNEWEDIQKQIQAKSDDFHIFGIYNNEFTTILPFKQGIAAGFWNNLGEIKRREALNPANDEQKKQLLFKQAYFCFKKALELNPNDPSYHNNLALLYTQKEFAEAIVRMRLKKTKGEELKENENEEIYKQYLLNLLEAKKHYQKALELNPNNPSYHYNLALLYTQKEFAKATNTNWYKNFNIAFLEMKKAFDLEKTVDRFDIFFWVITQIPNNDNEAQQVFNSLDEETKNNIWEVYQNEDLREQYNNLPPELKFSLYFEEHSFWLLMKKYMERV